MSVKRLLDCTPSDLAAYRKTDLLDAIAGARSAGDRECQIMES